MKNLEAIVAHKTGYIKLISIYSVLMFLNQRGLGNSKSTSKKLLKNESIGEGIYTHELNNMMEPFRRVINYLGAIPKDFIPQILKENNDITKWSFIFNTDNSD